MMISRPTSTDEMAWREWNDAIGDDPRETWRCPDCKTLQGMRWCRSCFHDGGTKEAGAK